jgi:rhodanese-related sulfurtransferase
VNVETYLLAPLMRNSYLVHEGGVAAVVDPRRDVELYLAEARRLGVEIRHVLLTECPGDFVTGDVELGLRPAEGPALGLRPRLDGTRTVWEGDGFAFGDDAGQFPPRAGVLYDGSVPYADRVRRLNADGHPPFSDEILPVPLDRFLSAGAQWLDVRESAAFAEWHLAGSLCIPLSGRFEYWCGTLLDPARTVYVIGDLGREREAKIRLGRVGLDDAAYLEGGAPTLWHRRDLLLRHAEIGRDGLAGAFVLDVRTEAEALANPAAADLLLPLDRLPRRLGEVPRDRRIAVVCRTGHRSATAVSLLEREGILDAQNLAGGLG